MASKTRKRAKSNKRANELPDMPATQPDDRLLALDGELNRKVLELELLRLRGGAAGPEFELDVQSRLAHISELYGAIAVAKPKTLAGAAVLLRRVPAMLDDNHDVDAGHLAMASQLIDTALAVVELNAM